MTDSERLTMDRAYRRAVEIIAVLRFTLQHWHDLSNPRENIELATMDLANIATPGIAWRMIAKKNGLELPGDEADEKEHPSDSRS